MDAVEYEKGRRRMCRTNVLKKGSCEGCDAYSVLKGRCDFTVSAYESEDENVIKKNIAAVERWVKANLIKTRQSEFLKMFPDAIIKNGVIAICPQNVCESYTPEDGCTYTSCGFCRKRYWLTELTDND